MLLFRYPLTAQTFPQVYNFQCLEKLGNALKYSSQPGASSPFTGAAIPPCSAWCRVFFLVTVFSQRLHTVSASVLVGGIINTSKKRQAAVSA